MREPPLTDLILAADILAEYVEHVVRSAKGRMITFNASKIYNWCAQRGVAELLTGETVRQIKRCLYALYRAGALRKEGGNYVIASDSPLWEQAIRGLARVYLANVLSVPEFPPGERESVMRRKQLKTLIELAKRTRSVDGAWIAKVCRLLAEECTEERPQVRSVVLRAVEGVERELDAKIQQWRSGWPGHSEVWELYSRLIRAVELLMELPDRVAAARLCEALKRVRGAAESAIFPGAGPRSRPG